MSEKEYKIKQGESGGWWVITPQGGMILCPTQAAALMAARYLRSFADLNSHLPKYDAEREARRLAENEAACVRRYNIQPRDGCKDKPKPCKCGSLQVFLGTRSEWCGVCFARSLAKVLDGVA